MTTQPNDRVDLDVVNRIADRAFAQMVAMIHLANTRQTKRPGDPKVGGHPAACASSFHVLAALHLVVREVDDFVACKPHASPIDHAYHNLLRLFRRQDGTWLTDDEAKASMERLRKFAEPGEADVFQSYHAKSDPDSFHFLPSGTVGIPPVNSVYLALAHRFANDHGHDVSKSAHFWSLMGDAEYREGSLLEVMPEAAERELGNVTWILDYNRQGLDGTRVTNESGTELKDCDRAERSALANGWKVIQLRHGKYREQLFEREGGQALAEALEQGLTDYEYQLLLFQRDASATRKVIAGKSAAAGKLLASLSDEEVMRALSDVGGHDLELIIDALERSKTEPKVPYLIIAHTIKGFGMECYADPANHSTLLSSKEVDAILERNGLSFDDAFAHFEGGTEEAAFLDARQVVFRKGIEDHIEHAQRNRDHYRQRVDDLGGVPETMEIDLAMFPMVHTQQMWGQLAAKLIRIGTHGQGGAPIGGAAAAEKPLTDFEARWQPAAELFLTLSPDVGTSTNLAPTMNARIYGPGGQGDVFEARHPELTTGPEPFTRHLRFEITEANAMSAVGSLGMMGKLTGVPLVPVMTVYDFFIKRALDQLYYNLYWGAEFIMLGTPSGVTLSAEGAQHSWKSDIQMPNLIAWEPLYAVEVDWILSDAIGRQVEGRNEGRSGVLVRGVTRALKQRELLAQLRRHAAHKAQIPAGAALVRSNSNDLGEGRDEASLPAKPDGEMLESMRRDCLAGGYYLVDWRGYAGYEPGDNVVHIFAMGSVATEAVTASERLLERGIYANVIVVTSPDLLCGILGHEDDYRHLREGLGVNGDLHLSSAEVVAEAELIGLAGRRVPIVAVCDGEAGFLDNLGSIVGVRQVTCAVRRFSKCGRPDQIYTYQILDAEALFDACGRVLAETALENLVVSESLRARLAAGGDGGQRSHWRELWPAGQSDA